MTETTTLWRPTGPQELDLVRASGWKARPPRLPDQPIFHPVLNEQYAITIARDCNVPASGIAGAQALECVPPSLPVVGVRRCRVGPSWMPSRRSGGGQGLGRLVSRTHMRGRGQVKREARASGAGEPVRRIAQSLPVGGEAAPDVVDDRREWEKFGTDELVEVVGTDGVPVDAFGGDGDFGDECFDGEHHALASEAPLREGPHELIRSGDSHVVEQFVQGVLVVAAGGRDGGGYPYVEAFAQGLPYAIERALPGAGAAMPVVQLGCGRVKADLQAETVAGHAAQHV
jgi:hypothetical protein